MKRLRTWLVSLGVIVGVAWLGPQVLGLGQTAPARNQPTTQTVTPLPERPPAGPDEATAPPSIPAPPVDTPSRGPSSAPSPSDPRAPTARAPDPADPSALTALEATARLPVKGRAPRTGYERDLFGQGWIDTDRNGCDTRNDILDRDLADVTYKEGTRDCVVLTGTLLDPFSGQRIDFVRGNKTSNLVQVDHVVALSDAWQKGAQYWEEQRRIAFANDPLNLLAVSGSLNQQKGDGDTATWLPPNKAFRCSYVARQVAVKQRYELWVTGAEQDAMVRVLSGCPAEPLPA